MQKNANDLDKSLAQIFWLLSRAYYNCSSALSAAVSLFSSLITTAKASGFTPYSIRPTTICKDF